VVVALRPISSCTNGRQACGSVPTGWLFGDANKAVITVTVAASLQEGMGVQSWKATLALVVGSEYCQVDLSSTANVELSS
jgi:hypothetical protein